MIHGMVSGQKAADRVSLRCPSCGQNGTFEGVGPNDASVYDSRTGRGVQAGLRQCPNADCQLIIARLDFIEQVMTEHGDELAQETWNDLPTAVKALKPRVELEAEIDEIARLLMFEGSAGEQEHLALAPLTISDLDERYGDPEEDAIW